MSVLRGIGKFAEGMANGYTAARKDRREQERHDLEMERMRNEQAMNKEIREVESRTVSPSEGYVVTGQDGASTIYTDKKMAEEAAAVSGAQIAQRYLVAGKQFESMDDAQAAADSANSPAVKVRQQAEIARKWNRPDIADAYYKNYTTLLEANRRDLLESFSQARAVGDYNQVIDAYNKRLPNGVQAAARPTEDGGLALQLSKGGKPIGQPMMFKSSGDFWDAMGQQVMTTPDNMLEVWRTGKSLGLQERQVAMTEKTGDAQIKSLVAGTKKTEAETTLLPEEMRIRGMTAAASMKGAMAAETTANTQRIALGMPKVYSGADAQGNVAFTLAGPAQDANGAWTLQSSPMKAVPGLHPMPKPDSFGLGLGTGGAPVADSAAIQQQLGQMFPPKNLGQKTPAAAPAAGGTQTTPPAPGARQVAPGVWSTYPSNKGQ